MIDITTIKEDDVIWVATEENFYEGTFSRMHNDTYLRWWPKDMVAFRTLAASIDNTFYTSSEAKEQHYRMAIESHKKQVKWYQNKLKNVLQYKKRKNKNIPTKGENDA